MASPSFVPTHTTDQTERREAPGRGFGSAMFSLHLALRARVRATTLDRELASGADARRDRVLERRALQLTAARMRGSLARSLDAAITEADRAPRSSPAAPVSKSEVAAARPELRAIIRHLTSSLPATPEGVARVRCLLTEAPVPCMG